MNPDPLSYILLGFLFFVMALWVVIYFNRLAIVRWFVKRKAARGEWDVIETILREARTEHMITYADDEALRKQFEIPTEGKRLDQLVKFYFPARK